VTAPRHGPTPVLVRLVMDPDGQPRVSLQLEDGYVLLLPKDARRVADLLSVTANLVTTLGGGNG
jgi:hypothetical protein